MIEKIKMSKSLRIADLFCGAGGLSLPFYKRGHSIDFAIDIDKYSIETFKHNHKSKTANILNENIKSLFKIKSNLVYDNKFDLVMGGPPCQGFSTANRQNIINDPRNELYKYFLKFISNTNPKFVIIENVVGIKNKANDIISELDDIGYSADYRVLQASSFGIPQNRRRVIFFAVKKKLISKVEKFFKLIDDKEKENKKYFLKDALFGLRPLKPHPKKNDTKNEIGISGYFVEDIKEFKSNKYLDLINYGQVPKSIFNHKARFNNERDIEIFKRLPQGADSTHKSISDIMPYTSRNHIFKDKYYKLVEDKISKTITSHMKFDCNMYIHPTQARGLTPREAARIQSFPDTFFFCGPLSKTYMQIGNAVPPLMAKALCEAVESLNND